MKTFNVVAKALLAIWMLPLITLMKKGERSKDVLLGVILKRSSTISDEYHLIKSVPRTVDYLRSKCVYSPREEDVAIVIQGPIAQEDDFTLNSVKLYRQLFPGAKIILSTWETEDARICDACSKAGAEVLVSPAPENVGTLNVNLQILSSRFGINKAKSLGARYVLKTRTDQRVTAPAAFALLKGSLETFHQMPDQKLSSRIIFLGDLLNSYVSLAFHVSDFVMFGEVGDLEKVFDIPLDNRPYAFQEDVLHVYKAHYKRVWENERILNPTIPCYRDYNNFILKLMAPEQYVLFNFVNEHITRIDVDSADLLGFYWDILKKYLIVLDKDQIGFYWHKTWFKYIQPDAYKRSIMNCGQLTFTRWQGFYLEWMKELGRDSVDPQLKDGVHNLCPPS